MIRNIIIALILVLAGAPAYAGENVLTGKTLVTGDVVRLGDLFTNTGRYADHVLAPAPAVGDKLVLTKTDLDRVVDAFRLDWDGSNDAIVAIERDAVAISADDIIQALAKSDLESKISGDASFELSGFDKSIVLDGQDIPLLSVSDTSFDPSTEKFSATLHISRDGNSVKDVRVYGLATPMVTVPVLRASADPNTIIAKADIIERTMAKRELRGSYIQSKAELIGMTVKRTLQPNQPIKSSDVTPPMMVKRNELVTVIYQNGPISLSTKARAMSNGTKGDSVTLININSKKPFDAMVTGPQQAVVDISDING